jgi:hypothetical protein
MFLVEPLINFHMTEKRLIASYQYKYLESSLNTLEYSAAEPLRMLFCKKRWCVKLL